MPLVASSVNWTQLRKHSDLEDTSIETSKLIEQREKRLEKNTERITQDLWDNYKNVTCVMGIPEGKERQKSKEETFELTMTDNFPKLMSDTKPQPQEAQRTPSRTLSLLSC